MNGFLSDGMRDLISVAGILLALANPVFFVLKFIFRKNQLTQIERQDEDLRRNSLNLLQTHIGNYFRSPTQSFKTALHIALISFLITASASLISLYTPDGIDNGLFSVSLLASIVQFFAFFQVTAEVEDGVSQNLTDTNQKKFWRFALSVIWSAFLILYIFLFNILSQGSWLSTVAIFQISGMVLGFVLLFALYLIDRFS